MVKSLVFSLVVLAMAGVCQANDNIQVSVLGIGSESLWRIDGSDTWHTTTGNSFVESQALFANEQSFDLRPGGANWYSTHTLIPSVEKNAYWPINVGQVVGNLQTFNYGKGAFNLPIYTVAGSVPEPATALMGLVGLLGVGLLRRR